MNVNKLVASVAAAVALCIPMSVIGVVTASPASAQLSDSQKYMRDGNVNKGKVVAKKTKRMVRSGPAGALLPYRVEVRRVNHGRPNQNGASTWIVNSKPLKGATKKQSVQCRMQDSRSGTASRWTPWRGLAPDLSDKRHHKVRPNIYEARRVQCRLVEASQFTGSLRVISRTQGTGWLGGR